MAVTLAQAALLSENDLQRGVIETFVQLSPVLDRLPLMPIEGNAYAYNKEATLPGVAFRSVNEAYTESTGTVNQATESLVILGGDADVDRFIVQTRGNLNDQRAVQTRLKVKAASYKFQDTFFNGDVTVDTKAFDGLKKRLTGAQVIAAGTNGIPVLGNGGTDTQTFFDKLDELLSLVPGMPPTARSTRTRRSPRRSAPRVAASAASTSSERGHDREARPHLERHPRPRPGREPLRARTSSRRRRPRAQPRAPRPRSTP
jgi:hypothetical protein